MEITVDFDTSPLSKLGSNLESAKAQGLNESAQTLVRFLMTNSPVDQGLLRSWFIESLTSDEATIKTPANYAIYQDQGTSAHMIQPRDKKALHWDGHFSKGHMVSGVTGKHFVQDSLDQLSPLMPGFFLRAFEEAK